MEREFYIVTFACDLSRIIFQITLTAVIIWTCILIKNGSMMKLRMSAHIFIINGAFIEVDTCFFNPPQPEAPSCNLLKCRPEMQNC